MDLKDISQVNGGFYMRTLMSISTIIADRITRIKVLYDTMVQNSKLNKKT